MLFRLLCWITTIPPFQNFKLSFSKHFCSLSYNIFLPNKSFLFPASEWFFVSFNILVLHSSWVHISLIEIYFKTSLQNRYFIFLQLVLHTVQKTLKNSFFNKTKHNVRWVDYTYFPYPKESQKFHRQHHGIELEFPQVRKSKKLRLWLL